MEPAAVLEGPQKSQGTKRTEERGRSRGEPNRCYSPLLLAPTASKIIKSSGEAGLLVYCSATCLMIPRFYLVLIGEMAYSRLSSKVLANTVWQTVLLSYPSIQVLLLHLLRDNQGCPLV